MVTSNRNFPPPPSKADMRALDMQWRWEQGEIDRKAIATKTCPHCGIVGPVCADIGACLRRQIAKRKE